MAEKQQKVTLWVYLKDQASKGLSSLWKSIKKSLHPVNVLKKALTGLAKTFTALKRSIFGLPGLIAGLGVGLLAKSFIDAASSAEQFRTRLTVLLGSVEEGNRLFKEMSDLAGRVPKTYEEIMQAATNLAGVMRGGVDEIKQWMPLIIDLSAATGLTVEETTSQIIRMYSAGAASADMFRERGVLAMLGFMAGVSYSAEETRKRLMDAWLSPTSQFRDASLLLASTWDGLMSMMGDAWFQFRNMVMDSGLFDFLKGGVKFLLDEIQKLREDGRLQEWAEGISTAIVDGLTAAIRFMGTVGDTLAHMAGGVIEAFVKIRDALTDLYGVIPGVTTTRERAANLAIVAEMTEQVALWKSIYEVRTKAYQRLQEELPATDAAVQKARKRLQEASETWFDYARLLGRAEEAVKSYTKKELEKVKEMHAADAAVQKTIKSLKETTTYSDLAERAIKGVTTAVAEWGKKNEEETERMQKNQENQWWLPPTRKQAPELSEAKSGFTQMKAQAAARTEMLKQWQDKELIDVDTYYTERLALVERKFAAEGAVLQAELNEQGIERIDKRTEIEGKIFALKEKKLQEQLKIDDDAGKRRLKTLNKQFKAELISVQEYYDDRQQIIDDTTETQLERLAQMRADSEEKVEAASKKRTAERLEIVKWYLSRMAYAYYKHDEERRAQTQATFEARLKTIDEHFDKEKAVQTQAQTEISRIENAVVKKGEEQKTATTREESEKRVSIAKKEAEQRIRLATMQSEAAVLKGDFASYYAAETQKIQEQYNKRRELMTEYHNYVITKMEVEKQEQWKIDEEIEAHKRRMRATDLTEAIEHYRTLATLPAKFQKEQFTPSGIAGLIDLPAQLDAVDDHYETLLEKHRTYTERLLQQMRDNNTEQAEVDRVAKEAEVMRAELHFQMMRDKINTFMLQISQVQQNMLSPMSGFFSDLQTIFQAFYESTNKQSKDWAVAYKTAMIAAGTIQAISAGLSAFKAGWEFATYLGGNPAVGAAIASTFMATTIAAGMAKVGMMASTNFAAGGLVPGKATSPVADNVNAKLTSGEFVHPVRAVQYYGERGMEAIQHLRVPRSILERYSSVSANTGTRMYAAGGPVRTPTVPRGQREQEPPTIVNILDRSMFSEFFATPEGDQAIVNVMSRRKDVIRAIARER